MSQIEQDLRAALAAVEIRGQMVDAADEVESVLLTGNKVTCILRNADDDALRAVVEATLKNIAPYKQVAVMAAQAIPTAKKKAPDPVKTSSESGINPAGIDRVTHIIAIASGKGGVGKSTVATNLAVTMAMSGLKVGLLDADIYGPSIPIMLGTQKRPESPDGKVMIPVKAHGLSTLSIGYMLANQDPVIWRGPMVHSALQQMLSQALWGDLDVLFIDMPPGTGDVALTMAQNGRLSGAVIVTTPQNVALADARKGIGMFQKVNVPILGVIENMAFHICPNCATKTAIFGTGGGKLEADSQNVPFLGGLPLESKVCQQGDMGRPIALQSDEYRGHFDTIAENLKARIGL